MKRFAEAVVATVMSAAIAVPSFADTVGVGGEAMFRDKTIVEIAVSPQDHTTLIPAVKAAGLVAKRNGTGPFTVFVPANAASAALPAGTAD